MTTQNILPFHKLGELVEITTGFAFKSDMFTENEENIHLVKGENLQQEYIDWKNAKRWPINEVNNLEKYFLELNDIVIAMDRPWVTAGLKWTYIKPRDPICLLVQRVARLRTRKKLNQIYLRYIIGSQYFSQYIQAIVTGINVPHISATQIANFQIPLPSLSIQHKVAAILSAYDELIENNNRRISILEKMAEEIYREWFVRLRFPGHENVKIVKGVPEGWEVRKILEFLIFDRGVEPGTDNYLESGDIDTVPFIRVGDLSKRDSQIFVNLKNTKNKVSSKDDILMSFDGTVGIVKFGLEGCYSSGIRKIVFKNSLIPKWYTYQLLQSATIQNVVEQHATGSTILHASSSIDFLTFVYPGESLLRKYEDKISPIFNNFSKIQKNINMLKKSRDLLLPRLISGKLDLENLDIAFPPGMKEEQEEVNA